MQHKRVLFFSAYANWNYHTVVEQTLANAMRGRGAQVVTLACDGLFPVCDVHRANLNPRKPNSCERCRKQASSALAKSGADFRWMSHFVPEGVAESAKAWSETLPDGELKHAHWRRRPVGAWALSSALYQDRLAQADWNDPAFTKIFREQLHGTVLALEAALGAFDELQPDLLVTLNGRFFAHRAAIEVARERGVRFVTHERGMQKNTLLWREGELTHELDKEKQLWARVANQPLEPAQIDAVEHILHERRYGKGMSWSVRYSPVPEDRRQMIAKLSLDERPIVALFTSSEDEQAAFPKWAEGAFQDGREWLDATLEIARATPSHQFVIRMHPGLVSMGANEAALIHANELRARCPENCRVVMPKDDLSSYTLADAADAAIVYYTTMGLEMAARGQRVVCVAAGWYAHAGFVHFVQKKHDYAAAVRDALGRGRDVELARAALRFSWQCFRVWSLPFDSVVEEPMSFGKPTYENLVELEPGRDPTLDRICDYLLEGKALFEVQTSAPSVEQLDAESQRLAQMEEAWRSPPADDAIDLILRAEAMFEVGRIEPACDLLLRALDQDPQATRAWKDLAAILHATGNPSEAIDALEKALHIDPSDREALEDLAAIRA